MEIIIMSCSGDYWYRDKVGKTYEVFGYQSGTKGHKKYIVKCGKLFKEILVNDCEVIKK